VSDPQIDEDCILILNLTTAKKFHDHSCVLKVGDHPFVRWNSCINYGQGYIISGVTIKSKLDAGIIEYREPMSQAVMRKILDGAQASDFTLFDYITLLSGQGLI
jgi:hypothetical protein